MNHANLKALILSNQRSHHRLMTFNANANTDDITVRIHYGVEIISRPNGTWTLSFNSANASGPAVDLVNLLTGPDFIIKKMKPRTYKFNEDFLSAEAQFNFSPDGTFTATEGSVIEVADLKEKTKALHVLTRRVRKKVQPQLRLLGADKFKHELDSRGHRKYTRYEEDAEIKALVNILDGNDIVKNMKIIRDVCDMSHFFGQGSRYSWNNSQETSEFRPKQIIDKILRRVAANKLAILEKYDERNRKATDRQESGTRRAA